MRTTGSLAALTGALLLAGCAGAPARRGVAERLPAPSGLERVWIQALGLE